MLEALEGDERNRGNCSAAEGAGCSAHAVRRLAVQLLQAAPPAPAAAPDWEAAAREMAVEIARNCNSVPQLVFPHLYLGLKDLFGAAPAQEHATQLAGQVPWRAIETAPNDGTLLRLLVDFETGNLEDDDNPQTTIGHNSFANTGEDEWQFAGWSWTHDCFVQGTGRVVG